MKYKVMIGDQPYRVAMSDGEFYRIEHDKDIIIYTVDEDEQVIHARIENPSQHTLYLISQGRCFLGINQKMTHKWSFYGNPGYGRTHIYRLGQRQRHPYWTKRDYFVKVTSLDDIQIPYATDDVAYKSIWYLNEVADYFEEPERFNYYITFKPILVSGAARNNNIYITYPNTRVYSTNSKETTLIIER